MPRMSEAEVRAYAARTGLTVAPTAPVKAQQPPARHLPPGVTVLHATLPGEGVSVNAAYANVPGRGRVATKALRDWKRDCAAALRPVILPYYPHAQPYLLELVFYGDWETLAGTARRADASKKSRPQRTPCVPFSAWMTAGFTA